MIRISQQPRRAPARDDATVLERSTPGWQPLPRSRRLVTDLLHFARQVPSQSLVRHCNVAPLAELRRNSKIVPRISWTVLFLRAYALLSARHPILRQCYMEWPWPHVYEHPVPILRMTVSRRFEGQDWVFFAHCPRPSESSLVELQTQVAEFKQAPVPSIERFRQQVAFSRFPRMLRRLAWWISLHVSGRMRIERFGTFGLTTVSSMGAISIHPPSLPTTTLTLGPIDEDGNVRVTIVYDHRLMDGARVAGFLAELEQTLNSDVLNELARLAAPAATEHHGRGITL